MWEKVEIDVDLNLVEEAIRRFHLADDREAVNLALRALLNDGEHVEEEEEYDEFSDLRAWQRRRGADTG